MIDFNEYEAKECKGANPAWTNAVVPQSKDLQKDSLTKECSAQKLNYVPKRALCFQKECVPFIDNYLVGLETHLGQ